MKTLLTTILILLSVTVIGQNKYCVGVSYPATVIGQNDSIKIKFKDNSRICAENLDHFIIGDDTLIISIGTDISDTYNPRVLIYERAITDHILITKQSLFEYETDCYNDTIKHSGNIVFGMPSHPYSYYQIGGEWYRRTRPTFKGFINWLKKK